MRIVEPKRKQEGAVTRVSRRRTRRTWPVSIIVFVGLSAGGVWYVLSQKNDVQQSKDVEVITSEEVIQTEFEEPTSGLRNFEGNEFRLLYDNTLLPNTEKIPLPPSITNDDIADTRIRELAENRGYKLRRIPATTLPSVDGYPLQESVADPWLQLKKEALSNSLKMSIVSGYRSIDDQRELFLTRLQDEGVSIADVKAGTADEEITKVLITTSIPGYSKHHSGYVFDLFCEGWAFEDFVNSACHDWLSANNYEHAKKYGFIPSYPEDADLQGPDPEAWEYVYVGEEILQYSND